MRSRKSKLKARKRLKPAVTGLNQLTPKDQAIVRALSPFIRTKL